MKTAVIYIHGKGGEPGESEHYKPLFPDCDVTGFDYRAETPWEAKKEFTGYFDSFSENYDKLILIANSIGAYFTLNAEVSEKVGMAFFISPVTDMENLITSMMTFEGVTEEELRKKEEIVTASGETLSWQYLCHVRENRVKWSVPTHILYGENDGLVSFETVKRFAAENGASLTVMPGGEHWFHTEEQMSFLDGWIKAQA